jgi:hypothetical protein
MAGENLGFEIRSAHAGRFLAGIGPVGQRHFRPRLEYNIMRPRRISLTTSILPFFNETFTPSLRI